MLLFWDYHRLQQAAPAILTISQVLLPAIQVLTAVYASGPMPAASVLCTHIVLHMLGVASAKGKKKVEEVIDLLDDDPSMTSQDLQGSPLPVSPLRVRLAGLLLVANCVQPSSTRLSVVASRIVTLHCSCVCATHSAVCFMHCAITYSKCLCFIEVMSSSRVKGHVNDLSFSKD